MKGLIRSQRRNPAQQPVLKQTIRVKDLPITVNGATGVGWGTAVVGDFPQGNILILGIVSYLQFKIVTAAGVQATFDGDYSLGTTPTADATLSGTDVNLVPSTATNPATAGVSPVVRGASSTPPGLFDNTDDSLEINLNFLIDDANISADTQLLAVNGTVHIAFTVLGDD
jgi:hypothetical protein